MRSRLFFGTLLVLLFTSLSIAQTHPNFSGTWVLNYSKSKLQMPTLQSSTFVINHVEPVWNVTRTHVWADGTDTFKATYTTDGKEYVQNLDGTDFHVRMSWRDSERLVLDSWWKTGDGERVTNVVTYFMSEGGKTFIADERVEGGRFPHVNHWVFEKK